MWTWDGTLSSFVGLGRFPVRMVIAGYSLPHDRLGLVVVAPLNPTPAVVEWLQRTGDVNFVVAPNKVGAESGLRISYTHCRQTLPKMLCT